MTNVISLSDYLVRKAYTPLSQDEWREFSHEIGQCVHYFLFMGSARDWIFNHLRVVFHVADVQDIPAEHYEAARALVRSKREAARSFSEFFAEKRDWFNREVLGGGAPWTPAIKSKLTKALNQKVSLPLRVIWGSTESPHGMKWDKDKPETVRHLCPHCRGAITQADYLAVWERGQWVSRCGNFTY